MWPADKPDGALAEGQLPGEKRPSASRRDTLTSGVGRHTLALLTVSTLQCKSLGTPLQGLPGLLCFMGPDKISSSSGQLHRLPPSSLCVMY